jgi:thiamine kinase-like enzyme
MSAAALRTRARVSAHTLWDHLADPPALEPGDVPWRPEAITCEWLTSILCRAHPGVRVRDVRVLAHSAGSSVRRRLEVRYEGDGEPSGLPRHLFAKSTPTVLTRLSSGMVAAREAGFFVDLRPALPIEAPAHRYSAHDAESGRTLHLFDDLVATRGASFCNQLTTISPRQAEDIIDLLATLHGRLFASPRLQSGLPWLTDYERYVRTSQRNGSQAGHERAMLLARHVIPDAVFARRQQIWPMLERGLSAHSAEPRTLLHSDVHLGNWYITAEGRMGLGDWALVCRGHWARDFAYAVTTTLATEDRRRWEEALLERYLDRLHREGGPALEFGPAWQRYRQQTFAALLMWTPTLCHSPMMPDMQPPEMSLEMIRRIATAIADLEAFDAHDAR